MYLPFISTTNNVACLIVIRRMAIGYILLISILLPYVGIMSKTANVLMTTVILVVGGSFAVGMVLLLIQSINERLSLLTAPASDRDKTN